MAKVAVLMCTYNGAQYLEKQLDSIFSQEHRDLSLFVSDDGSHDNTVQILVKYQRLQPTGRMFLQHGPKMGFAKNFLSLLARKDIDAEYFAFSDQDDVWASNKLTRALTQLASNSDKHQPALYCGRTTLIDEKGIPTGLSPRFNKPPSFANALVQNIGGGNTMVFNQSARDLLRQTPIGLPVVSHDWWSYIVVSAVGGMVLYDPNPTVFYRQHSKNNVGVNTGFSSRAKRIKMMLQGQFKGWNDQNIELLKTFSHQLTDKNSKTLLQLESARKSSFIPRVYGLLRSGIYRQTTMGNLGLTAAALLGKL